MLQVIVVGIFAVFLAFLARKMEFRHGLKVSFLLIFTFLALRYNYGNDYQSYLDLFNEVNYNYSRVNLFDGSLYGEIGWLILCRFFKPLGFFALVAGLALLNCIIYYRFISEFVVPKFYWLAVFIYVFDPGFMLIHLSAMRQSLAISIFLISLKFIIQRKFIPYILCILLASFFHSSALMLLPAYFLYLWKPKFNWFGVIIVLSIFIAFFIFKNTISPILAQFVGIYFSKYNRHFSIDGAVLGSGLGVLYSAIMLSIVLYYSKYHNEKFSPLINLVIVSFLFIPLSLMFELFSRPAMYLLPCLIVVYPMTISYIKDKILQKTILTSYVFYTVYIFHVFFSSSTYEKFYENYHSIIQFF